MAKKSKADQQPAVDPSNPAHDTEKSPQERSDALSEQIADMHREQGNPDEEVPA